ncbi:MAG TPA: hypothetical protein VFI96_05095 [Longimicrobiaceae bacterium]|nr:hypothetical protein [Longimicrobiaceae bacterium]
MFRSSLAAALLLPLLAGACDQAPTTPAGAAQVGIRFSTTTATGLSADLIPTVRTATTPAGDLVVEGSNGTLTISAIGFVVSKLELRCLGEESHDGAGCARFRAAPSFVPLPLENGAVDVATAAIEEGTYTRLRFRVEDLEDESGEDHDDDAGDSADALAALLASIRQSYPDFPSDASMVVEGSFTPAGETEAVPFRAYFEAEIKVEMTLDPPLTISDAGASRDLVVDVQPALWFQNGDGTVVDLSRFDYAETGKLVEFELKMDRGFHHVEEHEDHHGGDDD